MAPGSLGPNLDFYEPRTAHGSSLSPGIHAALFARCMAGHGSPVGEPRFSHGKGGFSVSFPSYDVRRLSFRAAYVHCGPLLGP